MVKFQMNEEFKTRLDRISSPIADYIKKLKRIDNKSKDYVNFIGVSRDNPLFISYMDLNREKKNKPHYIKRANNSELKIKFKKSAFTACIPNKLGYDSLPSYESTSFPWDHPEFVSKEFTATNSNNISDPNIDRFITLHRAYGNLNIGVITFPDPIGTCMIYTDILKHIRYIKSNMVRVKVDPRWEADKRSEKCR